MDSEIAAALQSMLEQYHTIPDVIMIELARILLEINELKLSSNIFEFIFNWSLTN